MSTAPEATRPTPMYRTAGTGFVWWSASPSQLNSAPMHTSVIPNRYGRCDSSGTISAISGCGGGFVYVYVYYVCVRVAGDCVFRPWPPPIRRTVRVVDAVDLWPLLLKNSVRTRMRLIYNTSVYGFIVVTLWRLCFFFFGMLFWSWKGIYYYMYTSPKNSILLYYRLYTIVQYAW